MCIKSTMNDSITPYSYINEEHAPAPSITARHKTGFCAQLKTSTDQHPGPLCAMPVRRRVCWRGREGARRSLSIKFTQSRDRAGRTQRLQTSAARPNSTFCWQQGKGQQRATVLFIYTRHTLRSNVIRQLRDREGNGRWQFSLSEKVCFAVSVSCLVLSLLGKQGDFV